MNYDNFDYNHEHNDDADRKNLTGDTSGGDYDYAGAKKHFSKIGLGYMLLCAVSVIAANIIVAVTVGLYPELASKTWFLLAASAFPIYAIGFPALWLVLRKQEATVPKSAPLGAGKFFIILIICFGVSYIGSYAGNFLMSLLSAIMEYDYSNSLVSVIDSGNIWVIAIFTVIIAPIGEELLFRKLLIDRTRKYGGAVSIFISGLFFGLMHGNLFQFFYAFALGLIFAYVYYITGRVLITIVLHAVINFTGSILSGLLIRNIDIEAMGEGAEQMMTYFSENPLLLLGFMVFGLFVICTIVSAPILLLVFRKKILFEKEEKQIPKGSVIKTAFNNAGMISAVAVYILFIIIALIPY